MNRTAVSNKMVEIFKEAWHAADKKGLEGLRVVAGLEAVLNLIDPAKDCRELIDRLLEDLAFHENHEGSPVEISTPDAWMDVEERVIAIKKALP